MAIVYALVSREKTVLSEYSATTGKKNPLETAVIWRRVTWNCSARVLQCGDMVVMYCLVRFARVNSR